jgi:hypothetical protein
MPVYNFHFIVALICVFLGLITGDAGDPGVALVFLLSALALIGIGLWELDRE